MDLIKPKILVVDDDEAILEQIKWSLKKDYEILLAGDSNNAIKIVKTAKPDIVLLDLALTQNGSAEEGLQLFEDIQMLNSYIKVIIMTGNEQRELALKAVQMGAYDYYRKPIELQELRVILKRALQLQKLEMQLKMKAFEDENGISDGELIGKCPKMLEIYDIIKRTSHTDATILITGESGTGKELVAKAIHLQSPRKDYPFIVINCGAIPDNLLESELFGHEKGAYTGAHIQRKGKFELANKGTIFLDEIGELSVALQVKLLRFLQDHEIERIGGREPIELDVRIIAATNRDLEAEVEAGNFRADLYYRLSVITINMPPLRERGEDIMTLAKHFFKKFNYEYQKNLLGFSVAAEKIIMEYSWPGNVRELENKIKRAVIMAKDSFIMPEDLNLTKQFDTRPRRSLKEAVEAFEEKFIQDALIRNRGNVSRTAKELGVNRTTFYDMLHKYNIDHTKYKKLARGK
ncbi:MAG: PEP-CTERM-box response regulator transcription factor [Calditrichaeota bacterium]|nr:MAG: PEP-CTERM-box response regulator transcription factor [Calditrichota bacterium]